MPISGSGRNKRWYRRRRAAYIAYLGGKCAKCGAKSGLEFHHVRKPKLFNISNNREKPTAVFAELDKCELRCDACHKKAHEAKHGTLSRYSHQKCRCEFCKDNWNFYLKRKRRDKRRKMAQS